MAEWAYLPEELLNLIISKLFDQDRQHFRFVCKSWNAAAEISPYPINAPCLIHYVRKKLLWGFFQNESSFYRTFPADFNNAEILCSKYGWLLMSDDGDDGTLFFFNPFNRHTKPIIDLYWTNVYWTCKDWYTSIHFFHPPTSPDCFIIGITTPGDDDGTRIDILRCGVGWESATYKNESEHEFLVSNSAPVLHHGLVHFLGVRGDDATLDIERGAWTVYPKSLEFRKLRTRIKRHYLLKINGDEDTLYVVLMIHERETVNVFRLLEPEMKWERVRDLGDKRLYLSLASSFGEVAKPKSMANTICFPIYHSNDNPLYYSLKTKRYHSFDGNHSFDDSIGLTRLHYNVTWITPIPTHQLSSNPVWHSDNEDGDQNDFEVDVNDVNLA